MNVFKYYVDVVTLILKDGVLQPLAVVWMDRRYKVDKVLSVRETYSKAGGSGICYRCLFGGQERSLFWERNRWFLESETFIPELLEKNH
ncbi:MAG: hypothetical protein HUJ55_00365 [Ileibacterium sp.]|nr:hypothetical protein [Ileibacterium sp.]